MKCRDTYWSRVRRRNVRNFQILIVSAVKIRKQCLQTASTENSWHQCSDNWRADNSFFSLKVCLFYYCVIKLCICSTGFRRPEQTTPPQESLPWMWLRCSLERDVGFSSKQNGLHRSATMCWFQSSAVIIVCRNCCAAVHINQLELGLRHLSMWAKCVDAALAKTRKQHLSM